MSLAKPARLCCLVARCEERCDLSLTRAVDRGFNRFPVWMRPILQTGRTGGREAVVNMNGLIWSGQVVLAAAFLLAGWGKLVAYEPLARLLKRRARGGELGRKPGAGRGDRAGGDCRCAGRTDAGGMVARLPGGATGGRGAGAADGVRGDLSLEAARRGGSGGDAVSAGAVRDRGAMAAVSGTGNRE